MRYKSFQIDLIAFKITTTKNHVLHNFCSITSTWALILLICQKLCPNCNYVVVVVVVAVLFNFYSFSVSTSLAHYPCLATLKIFRNTHARCKNRTLWLPMGLIDFFSLLFNGFCFAQYNHIFIIVLSHFNFIPFHLVKCFHCYAWS